MKEYATLTLRQLHEFYIYPNCSRDSSSKTYSKDFEKGDTAFQVMLRDGWEVTTAAIQTNACSSEVGYLFVLERDIGNPNP